MSRRKQQKDTTQSPYPTRSQSADRTSMTVSNLTQSLLRDPESDNSEQEEQGTQGSVSVSLIRQIMKEMETNINARIDRKVDEVKAEVGQLKTHVEKSNERFDDMQDRISKVEEQVNSLEDVKDDVASLREEWQSYLTEADKDACRARKNHIIFQGVPGENQDPPAALGTFKKVCETKLKLPKEWVREVDVNDTYRFPSKNRKGPWPLFISLAKSRHRTDIYKSAFNLKDSGITMSNDLAPCLIKIRKRLKTKSDTLKAAPHNLDTKLRDTPFRVWLEVKKKGSNKWEEWKGKY